MELKIRLENKDEFRTVEELTREAFWNIHVPGCDEHFYLHNLRNSDAFIKELDFVALYENKIVGHIAYSKANIVNADNLHNANNKHNVIIFGPISVLPEYQSKGVGSALIKHSLEVAKSLGYKAVLIYGDPRYYSKFGFRCAERYDIKTPDGKYCVPMMALELEKDALSGVNGRLIEGFEFTPDEREFEKFDNEFPPKEKGKTASQEEFKILSSLKY